MTTTDINYHEVKDRKMSDEINVKVTDYNCSNVNPSPIKLPKDTELLEEFLSPRKLQTLTGVDNLETVEYLEMRVNTEQMSLGNFGMYLPNLSQLKLSGSLIPSIRDLGTSLFNLQVLWMPQCALNCLDGLVTMASLRELYLAYNEIEDISPCGMLENLEILDLEGNFISDATQLHYLSMCSSLTHLSLEGNPLCQDHSFTEYKALIQEALPQLQYLDDQKLINNHYNSISKDPSNGDGFNKDNDDNDDSYIQIPTTINPDFEQHWDFINKVLLESGLLADSSKSLIPIPEDSPHTTLTTTSTTTNSRDSGRPPSTPSTASIDRPLSSGLHRCRPSTSGLSRLRPTTTGSGIFGSSSTTHNFTSGNIMRPYTATGSNSFDTIWSGGNSRPDTAGSSGADSLLDENGSEDSQLTAGKPVCGSVARSLKRLSNRSSKSNHKSAYHRTKSIITPSNDIRPQTMASKLPSNTEELTDVFSDETCDQILEELNNWRKNYEESKARIEAHRAPQILTLDDNEKEIEEKKTILTKTTTKKSLSDNKKSDSITKQNITTKPTVKQLNPLKTTIGINNNKLKNEETVSNQSKLPTNQNTSTNGTNNNQLSRIRKQLLQAGSANALIPSKPQLKKM